RLASSIPLLAQGIPFIHAGQEFQRSKGGDSNSYQSGDEINSLKWNLVTKNADTRSYFKGLLKLRAAHPALRMDSAESVKRNLRFLKSSNDVIAYSLNGANVGDSWKTIVVIHNAGVKSTSVALPSKADWKIVVEGKRAGVSVLKSLSNSAAAQVPALSTMVLYLK
ncbi:MAG: alpha-1,6-glucosidase domain-containing protein, partial [Actinomycetota bacterium]